MNVRLAVPVSGAIAAIACLAACNVLMGGQGDKQPASLGRQSAGVGSIRVSLVLGGNRTTLATTADVSGVIVALERAGEADRTVSLSKTQLTAGGASASAAFEGIVQGEATVSAKVVDAFEKTIGSAKKAVTVLPGQIASVSLSIDLLPTYLPAPATPTPAPGAVAADIAINDGKVIYYNRDHGQPIDTSKLTVYACCNARWFAADIQEKPTEYTVDYEWLATWDGGSATGSANSCDQVSDPAPSLQRSSVQFTSAKYNYLSTGCGHGICGCIQN